MSDTEKRIEKRLAELYRPIGKEQSPQSNLVGNSDGRYAPQGNTSSGIGSSTASRAQSVASSGAKIRNKKETAMI